MESRHFAGMSLSRLMIGTVQFGMPYGIANRTGQPSYKDVCDILACASEGGVTCLDTASAYGESEEVLGRALAELGLASRFTVVTKAAPLGSDLSAAEADAAWERSITESLNKLRLDVLPICLIHHEENFRYIESLLRLKQQGLIGHAGCSVMTPAEAKKIVASGLVEAMQVPTSMLDRRYVRAGVFSDCRQRDMALFVRSMYLQGLLLLPPEELRPGLAEVVPVLRRLRSLAADAGMELAEMAVRYVLALDGTMCGVVGVETLDQMRRNVAIFDKGPLPAPLVRQINDLVPDLSDTIVMPNKWPKA